MRKKIIIFSTFTLFFVLTTLSCQRQFSNIPQVSHDSKLISSDQKLSNLYHVIYTDLDGTALDTTGTIREETIKAVKAFKDRGGRIGIATGRILEQAQKAIEQLDPNLPIVLFNGGVIADLNKHALKVLGHLDNATMRECITSISTDTIAHGLIMHFPTVSIPDRDSQKFKAIAEDHQIKLTFEDDLFRVSADSLVKIVILSPAQYTEKLHDKLKAIFEHSNLKTSRVVISSPVSVEVLPLAITKAAAIKMIAEQIGFSMDDVLAFGDSGNDVEMLREVGLGVVMWNGRPEAKEAADIIIGPNYSDSIAKFLNSPIMQ